ncbi:hypothetical protein [Sporosarcina highlanderae]|uniref:DUF4367 domain-containing protein n=1 Tax=Sporosarcina highlanderae TaxID=3035916 RepID=A0ABT8JNR6_9BACL|nr:hypothetical protein [Sporosarcina highlanderae]MDN4606720.1 hypothetical protein [Sporosarcina highlanderae]
MNEPTEKEIEFLQNLRNRPDKDPDREFVNRLQRQLIQPSTKKRPKFIPIAVTSLAFMTFLAVIFLFFNQPPSGVPLVLVESIDKKEAIENTPQDGIMIFEQEQAKILLEVPYGEGSNEIGMPQKRPGGSDRAVESFYVKDDVFYLLDNAARKVIVTTPKGYLFTIQLDDSEDGKWYRDIFVDDDDNIYVLDSSYYKGVSKFSPGGELLEVFPIKADMMDPNAVVVNERNEILVHDVRPLMENLMTGEITRTRTAFEKDGIIAQVVRKDEQIEVINIEEAGNEQKITVPFDHTTGGIRILDIRSDQIIFEKTEVADTHKIMAEFHVYVIDKEGNVLGAVKEPHEESAYYSTHSLRMVDDKIFYLSAGADSVVIFELIPGKQFEKKLQDRIDEFLNE